VGETKLECVGTVGDGVKTVVFNLGAVPMVVIGAGLVIFVDSNVAVVELGT